MGILRIFHVKAGKHDFWPPEMRVPYRSRGLSLTWDVVFDATCAYTLPGEDQRDFNKGGGVSLELFSNNRNALMWGWRYTPDLKTIELCQYVNRKSKHEIGTGTDLVQLRVPIGQRCRVNLTYLEANLWQYTFELLNIDRQPVQRIVTYATINTPSLVYRLGLWFGGNRPAPQDMQVWVDFQKS